MIKPLDFVRTPKGAIAIEGSGILIQGDANHTPLAPASVDLCYIDPPFFTKRDFGQFNDKWKSLDVYLAFMQSVVQEIHRVLKSTGSFYLHCDWHASHYLKIMCDEVFGYGNFQNEVIWYYSGGGAAKTRWARKHDSILFYTKSKTWTFNADEVRVPHKWTGGQRRADGSKRDYKKGKLPDDVMELHGIMPWAAERVSYPTQKPLRLLERIIKASSNKGDVVLDSMCGSGTTLVAANNLQRKFVGIDVSHEALRIAEKRL